MTIRGTDSTDVYRLGRHGKRQRMERYRAGRKRQTLDLDSRKKWHPYQPVYADLLPPDTPGAIWYPQTAFGFERLPEQNSYLLKNGTVWTGEAAGILPETDVLLVNGKIAKIGKASSALGAEVSGLRRHAHHRGHH